MAKKSVTNSEKKESAPKEIRVSFEQLLAMYQQNQYLLDSLNSQEKLLNNMIMETQASQDAMREIKASEKETNMLVPLGAGVFAYAKINDNSAVKIEIGNNVFERMPIAKAIEKLEERKAQLESNLKALVQRKQQVIASLAQIERIIAEAQRKMQTEKTPGVA